MKKQKLQKKIIAVFLCMLMILSGSACARNQGKETDNKMQEMENDTYENRKTAEDSQGNEENKKNGEEKDKDSKEVIKLYTDNRDNRYGSSWLTAAVEYFNKENETYQIEVTNCFARQNKNGDLIEPEEVLQMEIEKQGEPDILYWSNRNLMKQYAKDGLLADLSSFLEQGEEPLVESYDKKILKASSIGGKLYQLPHTFRLKVLLGNKKMMGDKESWTMEEMMSLYKKLPESFMYMMDISKENYIGDVFYWQQSDYRDHDTGKFHVETEDFMNMLRFAKELPNWEADIGCSSKWTIEKMIPKGQLLLTREKIIGYITREKIDGYKGEIDSYEQYYKKAGGYNILSYPSTKNNGILMEVFVLPFAILESSKYKEEAWELLRFADNYTSSQILEEDEELSFKAFSVKKEILKESLKKYEKKDRAKIKDLLKRVGRITTEYDLQCPLSYGIHTSGKEVGYEDEETKAVLQIIMKNAEKYFKGKESVEKATKKIQKKLDEFYEKNRKK